MITMQICPFCGVSTESSHTQEGCLEALTAEIARVRAILAQVHSTAVPRPVPEPDSEDDNEQNCA
jgi:hypothetical protein